MERDGRAVLDFMKDNAEEIEKRTTILRANLSQTKSSQYMNRANDNWSNVFNETPQWEIQWRIPVKQKQQITTYIPEKKRGA